MRVREVMSRRLVTVGIDDDLLAIGERFATTGFHHLLVVSGTKLLGVISDRDLLRTVSPFIGTLAERTQDRETLRRKAHQLMTRDPITVNPEDEVQTAAIFLVDKKISCLPVVSDEGELEGIVTWRDLLRAVAVGK